MGNTFLFKKTVLKSLKIFWTYKYTRKFRIIHEVLIFRTARHIGVWQKAQVRKKYAWSIPCGINCRHVLWLDKFVQKLLQGNTHGHDDAMEVFFFLSSAFLLHGTTNNIFFYTLHFLSLRLHPKFYANSLSVFCLRSSASFCTDFTSAPSILQYLQSQYAWVSSLASSQLTILFMSLISTFVARKVDSVVLIRLRRRRTACE